MTVREMLFTTDPYEGLDIDGYVPDVQGWGGHEEFFKHFIEKTKPKLIVEVGTWKGKSAITMAKACDELGLDTEIVCVDTWLGAGEFWEKKDDEKRYKSLKLVNGYPTVYYTFLKNVKALGHEKRITPFPQSSINAARVLWKNCVKADLIYIDASHEYADVKADLFEYYTILRKNGTLMGDDYCLYWNGVMRAVDAFSNQMLHYDLKTYHMENGPGEAASDYWVLERNAK